MTGGGNIYPSAPQEYSSTTEKGNAGGYQSGGTMGQALVPKGHNPEWTTTLVSCDRPMSTCLYAYFCPNCALATMRTEYDGSNWLFNCLCLAPVIARNMLRSGYNIEGSVGGDICLPLFCGPCVTAQMLHEVRTRGPIKNTSQPNTEPWRHSLFSFDLMACIFGWFLPNCGMAAARENFDGSSFLLNCCCLTPALGRNLIREGYGIEGSCCGDICATMWLGPCVVSQLYQESKSRGKTNHSAAPGTHYMK